MGRSPQNHDAELAAALNLVTDLNNPAPLDPETAQYEAILRAQEVGRSVREAPRGPPGRRVAN